MLVECFVKRAREKAREPKPNAARVPFVMQPCYVPADLIEVADFVIDNLRNLT